jgi:hypothetical protein
MDSKEQYSVDEQGFEKQSFEHWEWKHVPRCKAKSIENELDW